MLLLLQDRKFQLFGLVTLLALVLGFFAISAESGLRLVIYWGYWFTATAAVVFGWSIWRIFRVTPPSAVWLGLRREAGPLAAVAGCASLLLVHGIYGFKILMDEAMLLGTSMSMHLEKQSLVPMRAHDLQGVFEIMAGELDKRPLFFPFLTSLLHDLTGYRPENPWILNSLLIFVFFGLVYFIARRFTGRPAGGVLAVLLLTTLPLLSENATGAGFELLNLVMMAAALLLGMRWLERRDADSLTALVYAAILLAQVRYESVLFLMPIALMILWGWWLEKRVILSWPTIFAPLLLVIYPLHHRVFEVRGSAWELASQPGYTEVFSKDYIPANIGHALNYLFDSTGDNSNSLTLSTLGLLALPFCALWVITVLKRPRVQSAQSVALAFYGLGFVAWLVMMMCYFWGRFDDPVISRLSLPLHLFMALAIVVVIAQFDGAGRSWRWWIGGVGVMLATLSVPAMSRHAYTMIYTPGLEVGWRREFIAAHPERDFLMIDQDSIIWITHLVSATPTLQARINPNLIEFNLRNRSFSAIYVYQHFDIDPETSALTLKPDDDIGPAYTLEKVIEHRFQSLSLVRISRVTGVKLDTAPILPTPPSLKTLSQKEREALRLKYFENFVKHLP